MRQMTLRDIPDDVESVIRNEADLRGVSLNKAFLTVLTRGAQQTQLVPASVELTKGRFARFCGIWSDEEATAFDGAADKQRRIDSELWL